MRHDFDDGKYTVIFDEKTYRLEALRYGEPWQDLCGNNLVYFMLSAYDSTRLETAQLQARVAELEAARVTLVAQLHEALDQIERTLHLFRGDAEGLKQAEGCIAYARKVTAPFNYNGGGQ